MALYDVECDACGYAAEDVSAPMAEGPPKKCPQCKKNKLRQAFNKPVGFARRESPMHPRLGRGRGNGRPKKKEK